MKRQFILTLLLLAAIYSKAQLNLLGWCGSNANFAVKYFTNDKFVVAHFWALEFYDVSNPSSPFLITTSPLPLSYPIIAMQKEGDFIYTQGYGTPSVFSIVNTSNINNPFVEGYCNSDAYTGISISVLNDRAYVLGYDSIYVYDISNVSMPSFLNSYDIPGNAIKGIVIKNLKLAVLSDVGLNIFDIDAGGLLTFNSTLPQVSGNIGMQTDSTQNILYSCNTSTIKSFDISNLTNPVFKYQLTIPGLNISDIQVKNNFVYTTGGSFDVFRAGSSAFTHVASYDNAFGQSISLDAKDSSYILISTVDSVLIFSFNPNSTVSIPYFDENQKNFYSIFYEKNIVIIKSKRDKISFSLCNINGEPVLNKFLKEKEQYTFKDLSTGFYFLKIINESNHIQVTEKIIIYNEFR